MRVIKVKIFKNLKIIFLTLFPFFLIGCSNDKLIDADDNIINTVTKTIAPEIVIDDLAFSISSATFNVSPEIQLSTSITDNSFESNHLSKLYRIEELPYGYKKTLEVKLKGEPDSIVSGKIIPDGKPIDPPIRVKAGNVCIVDLVQNYFVTGTLSGKFSIDYRIMVFGPCGEPPGTYSEEWIAYGVFNGKLKGTPAFGKFSYIAKSKSGGEIVGKMVFNQGMKGNLLIKGNFNDGKLTYNGWLNE